MPSQKGVLSALFPVWNKLTEEEKRLMAQHTTDRRVEQATVLHDGSADCVGLFLVKSGQLRAYILSQNGKEITLYRLFDRDMCLFSASCMMRDIQFEVFVEAEKDTELLVIPTSIYQKMLETSIHVANYTNQLMASRFSDVMWLIDQILFKSLDARLAAFLLEQSGIEGGDEIHMTHERIARNLGTAREVISRMLKYFQSEGIVRVSRGGVKIVDFKRINDMAR